MADADYNRHIQEYIHAVQGALATLSVADTDVLLQAGGESSFLVFELLDRARLAGERRVFRPYVSDRVIDTLAKGSRAERTKAQQDLSAYQECEISTQWRASGLIYQAWKQGFLLPIYFPANHAGKRLSAADHILQGLFFMSDDEMPFSGHLASDELLTAGIARKFGLDDQFENKRFADGSQWFLADSPDAITGKLNWEEFNAIEFNLVHKVDPKTLHKFCLIHYPLVIDGYWFVGFAYLLKNLDGVMLPKDAELFIAEKYPKCLTLLHQTVAAPLKLALRERAFHGIDWRHSFDSILLEVARRYFVCFEVRGKSGAGVQKDHELACLYRDGIFIYGPKWIVENTQSERMAKEGIATEIDLIRQEIRYRMTPYVEGRRSAIASICSASLSHNIGSHVLSDARLFDPENANDCYGLKDLHRHLQGRMDYLAQLNSDSAPHVEPQYLFKDILGEFFRQRLLLNRLVSDRDFEGSAIEFVIDFSDVGADGPVANVLTVDWSAIEGATKKGAEQPAVLPSPRHDVLVGIPGGSLGRHALHTVLENMMRNSVKYGRVPVPIGVRRKLVITMRLRNPGDKRDYWLLELSDNLSGFRTREEVDRAAYRHLADEFELDAITKEGGPQLGSHGLTEIREAMRFLYPYEKGQHDVDGPHACRSDCGDPNKCCERGVGNTRPTPDAESGQLVYRVRLRRPCLLAVWNPGASGRGLTDWESVRDGIFFREKLTSLVELTPSLLVICDHGTGDVSKYVSAVAKLQWRLPFRLMVVCENPERKQGWSEAIKSKEMQVPEDPQPPGARAGEDFLPVNRVRVICDKAFWTQLSRNPDPTDGAGCIGGLSFVNDAYERWLGAYKPQASEEGDKWHLIVCFPRGSEVADRWRCANQFKSDTVTVSVYELVADGKHSTTSRQSQEQLKCCAGHALSAGKDQPKHVIHFGNHGAIPDEFKSDLTNDALAASYEFGAIEGPRTFDALFSPPTDLEPFRYFVFGVVEAALTEIAFFDERLLGMFADGSVTLLDRQRKAARRANLLPLAAIPSGSGYGGAWARPNIRGVDLNGRDDATSDFLIAATGPKTQVARGRCGALDILLLHEGLIEELISRHQFPEGGEIRFGSTFSRLVRMSGKGPQDRKLNNHLPFCEYSAVSACFLPYSKGVLHGIGIEKLNLARAVLSCFPFKAT